MPKPQDIFELIETEAAPDELCLSVYYPNPNTHTAEFADRIKAYTQDVLKSYEDVVKGVRTALANEIAAQVREYKNIKQGVALFVRFKNTSSNFRANELTVFMFFLPTPPVEEGYVGQTYDLDQLLWSSYTATEGLLLTIQADNAVLYTINDADIEKVREFENEFLISGEKEYLQKVSPMVRNKDQGIYHGTGEANIQRKKEEHYKRFLQTVLNEIAAADTPENSSAYLALVYTSNFETFIEQETRQAATQLTILPIASVEQDPRKMHETAISKILAYKQHVKRDLLKQAQEAHAKYAKGWFEVAEASREGKIKNLFITATASQTGYVVDNELVYLMAQPDSRKVKNIGPWLVRSVINSSGKVWVFQESSLPQNGEIAAELRY